MHYLKAIENYKPFNQQELKDKALMLEFIKRNPDHLYRNNLTAHLTSSAIVVNSKRTKVLFAYHNIYDSWSWVGGHNDGDPDMLKVAIKETKEETGVKNVNVLSPDIYMLDVIYVSNHIKRGIYVPDHLHLNITYLLEANEEETLIVKEDENQAVAWIKLEDVFDKISEPRMVPIYQKAFDKLKSIL